MISLKMCLCLCLCLCGRGETISLITINYLNIRSYLIGRYTKVTLVPN